MRGEGSDETGGHGESKTPNDFRRKGEGVKGNGQRKGNYWDSKIKKIERLLIRGSTLESHQKNKINLIWHRKNR